MINMSSYCSLDNRGEQGDQIGYVHVIVCNANTLLILDNEETFNLLNGTQQKQGQIDTPIPIKEDVSFDAESDELNIVNYPKVSVL